jgi:hypothetical protein
MKSPTDFVVSPLNNARYDNVSKTGSRLILSVDKEDFTISNRFGTVIETPINYDGAITKGDTLLVHHNVFRQYYDMAGLERNGNSYFRENMYLVNTEQFFLYKHNDEWLAPNPFCFIKPIEGEELVGTIRYMNSEMEAMGLLIGDKVVFQPDSEYEFYVEGEKLYRMYTRNLCLKL